MTTKILTNKIKLYPESLFDCKFIMLDEVHELSEEMIEVIYFVKYFLNKYGKDLRCPIFIMVSATYNIEKFIRYFGVKVSW